MKTNFRQHLLASTLLVGAVAYASPALAQDPTTVDPAAAPPSGPVEAQPTPSVSAEGEDVETGGDIIVTGSRIPQPNLESAAPVSVVSDQEVKLSGATRIEDVLNQLPSAVASQNAGNSNVATGTAEIELRYLGAKRTLSLVNGRRLTPGDPNATTQAGDINIIPASLIRRVEVLTGGASSVYGADAVAGVVNFIMDTNFEGIRFDGNISAYQHNNDCPSIGEGVTVCDELDRNINVLQREGYEYPKGSSWDGRAIDATVSIGASFDDGRGHAVGYFGYRKVKAITQAQRDYSTCTLDAAEPTPTCGGSSFSAEGNFLFFDDGTTTFYTNNNGVLEPGRTRYNFGPTNYYQRPDERYTAGVFADYEITPAIKPYLEFMFMDDHTLAQIAPSGNFANTFTINCDNPFLTANQDNLDLVCDEENLVNGFLGTFPLTPVSNPEGPDSLTFFDARGNEYQQAFFQPFRRNVEGGPRISDLKHTTYRGVFGVRGDLSPAFSYDAFYQYGATNYSQVYRNEFSAARLARSINVINVDADGNIVPVGTPGSNIICRSVLDNSDPNCVPYNYFGTPSEAAVNYLNIFGVIDGRTSEQVANLNFTGQLGELGFQTPWASDGIGINVGWEFRKEKLTLNPDQSFQQGDLTGQGAPTLPVEGDFKVNELFAEVAVPIVQRSFIEDLTLAAGYRKSWYKLSNDREYDTDTYKISLEFAPIADVRFRGSYNRAVRAPNIQELFAPQFVGLSGSTDPCSDIVIDADDFGCIAQGLDIGDSTPSNPSAQYNALLGGNPDLVPEKATTKTVGVILQPRFLPRFALTVDYWNIKVDRAIQGFGADAILSDCIANSTAAAAAPSCALVNRDAGGSIWLTPGGFVENLPSNVGGLKTDGIDVNVSYAMPLGGFGRLSSSFHGTYTDDYVIDNGITPPFNCAGLYGSNCSGGAVSSSSAIPQWRHKMRATVDSFAGVQSLGVSLAWRRVGKVKLETLSDDVSLSGGTPFGEGQFNSRIDAQNYFDLALTYTLFDKLNLRAGVNNIFDKNPPLIMSSTVTGSCPNAACNGNTYVGTWDYLGRYIWAGATLTFSPPKRAPLAPAPIVAPPPPPAPPATQTCPDGSVILATEACPVAPPPPPPPPPAPERG